MTDKISECQLALSIRWWKIADERALAEEIRDASRVLPRGMMWTLILNGSTGLVMIITMAFCVGDIDEVLASQTGFAFIQVFLNATGSVSAATGMTCVIMIMQFCAAISNVATTSRQIYSFARDNGLPFSSFFAQVISASFFFFLSLLPFAFSPSNY